jgi:hypothetical protein
MTSTDPCSQHTRTVAEGGQLQTAGSQPIENAAACPTSNPNDALGPGTRHDATKHGGRCSLQGPTRRSSCPYNPRRRHSALGYHSPIEYENMNQETPATAAAK